MAYKKDQGRYARMASFWGLLLLLGYGIVRPAGMVSVVRGWLGAIGDGSLAHPWVKTFPLLGTLDLAVIIGLVVLAACGLTIHYVLNRPKLADLLIDTEGELRKVTWPTLGDTWKGTLAVVFTVSFLLAYLTVADLALQWMMQLVMNRS